MQARFSALPSPEALYSVSGQRGSLPALRARAPPSVLPLPSARVQFAGLVKLPSLVSLLLAALLTLSGAAAVLLTTSGAQLPAASPAPAPDLAPPKLAPQRARALLPPPSPTALAASPTVAPAAPSPVIAPTISATAGAAPVARQRAGPVTTVPILMYHYIRELPANTPDRIGYGLSIPPVTFDQQLAYLARAGFHGVTMSQVTNHVLTGAPLPPRPIALTFDDGYSDFYTAALPLLQRYHFTATTFLVVNFLGRPQYMSWQQALQLPNDGIEVGAHTLDHVDLAIQPLATATREIRDSGLILRQRFGVPVQAFAYPSGRYDAAVLRIVAASGFTSAVTTNYGSSYTRAELLTLPRVRVYGGITMPSYIKEVGG